MLGCFVVVLRVEDGFFVVVVLLVKGRLVVFRVLKGRVVAPRPAVTVRCVVVLVVKGRFVIVFLLVVIVLGFFVVTLGRCFKENVLVLFAGFAVVFFLFQNGRVVVSVELAGFSVVEKREDPNLNPLYVDPDPD